MHLAVVLHVCSTVMVSQTRLTSDATQFPELGIMQSSEPNGGWSHEAFAT